MKFENTLRFAKDLDNHERLTKPLSKIVGAKPEEVSVMNTLTVNLHMLMVSFYRPTQKRFKIICEEKAFPSDQYMLQSQVRFHGFDPEKTIVEIKKREGEHFWHTEDIVSKIKEIGDELALVLIGGVNYYNGQVFDMKTITKAGKSAGAFHDWDVDFASWCSYKYMNSGPGNVSGIFVNEKYLNEKDIPRFEGWWGTKKETRFLMKPEFDPITTADAWQVSNPPVLSTFEIITPSSRGCQLSVFLHGEGRSLFDYLMKNGVVVDWREPNVIRLAPAPFYCSFEDMFRFGEILERGILSK